MKQDRVLIIDDDVELCRLLSERLQPEGFTIEAIYDIWDLPQRLLCAIMGSAFHQKICKFFLSHFKRVGTERDRQTGGTGLGFAITKRAIRMHGGEVYAANATPHGLAVHILLPLTT